MRFDKVQLIARKDLGVFLQRKNLLFSVLALPLIVGIALPFVVRSTLSKSGALSAAALTAQLNAFSFFFLIGAMTLPTAIAAYSLVGEKIEKSLEPLLATPITDTEILAGKALAALLPPLVATWIGGTLFMVLSDAFTASRLGYLYYPNATIALILLLLAPLAALLSVEVNVIVSSRATDVRTAQQIGGLMVVPFGALYVVLLTGLLPLTDLNLLLIGGALVLLDAGLLFVARATFQREEILTRWK